MSKGNEILIVITNEFDIVTARQKGREVAQKMGFPVTELAFIATAISELTRNIITYAQKGKLSIIQIKEKNKEGICVIAQDNGPGIQNIALALKDGYSTSNSLGLGLPGVQRLMDEFEIKSDVGHGTIITTKKWLKI